jgi:hypothetical protein
MNFQNSKQTNQENYEIVAFIHVKKVQHETSLDDNS